MASVVPALRPMAVLCYMHPEKVPALTNLQLFSRFPYFGLLQFCK